LGHAPRPRFGPSSRPLMDAARRLLDATRNIRDTPLHVPKRECIVFSYPVRWANGTTPRPERRDRRMSTTTPPTIALLSYSAAARVLGIDRKMVGWLVREMGMRPRAVPWNGKAKGLSVEEVVRIRRAWERLRETA
jgi:hypothetical protein